MEKKPKRKNKVIRKDCKITPQQAYEYKRDNPNLSFAKIGKIFDVGSTTVAHACMKYEKEMGLTRKKVDAYVGDKVKHLEGLNSKIIYKAMELLDSDEVKFRELAYAFGIFNNAVRQEKGEVTNDLVGFMNIVDRLSGNRTTKNDKAIEAEIVVDAEVKDELEKDELEKENKDGQE